MECFLTRRGRQLAQRAAAWVGWAAGVGLLIAAFITGSAPPRVTGLAVMMAAATWTVVLAIRSNNDVVRAAFEMGRAQEREAEVHTLR